MVYYTGKPLEKGIRTARHDLITVLEPHFYRKDPKSYFIKAIDHTFYGFYWCDKPLEKLGEHSKSIDPAWVITPVNP